MNTEGVTVHHRDDVNDDRTWLERELFRRRWSVRQLARELAPYRTDSGEPYSAQHIARVVKGEARPSTKLCREMARLFGMTEAEVLRHAGHMSPLPDDLEEAEGASLLELFQQLTVNERIQVLEFARFLTRAERKRREWDEDASPSIAAHTSHSRK